MAQTKQERRESWKKRTSATASALKKAGATITISKSGKKKRSVPLSATVVKPGEKESELVKSHKAGTLPTTIEAYKTPPGVKTERINDSNVYKVTYKDQIQYAYVTGKGDVRYTESLHRAQAHEGFRREYEPTHREIARGAMRTFEHKRDEEGVLPEKYGRAGVAAGTLVEVKPDVSKRIDLPTPGFVDTSLLLSQPPIEQDFMYTGSVQPSTVGTKWTDFLAGLSITKDEEPQFDITAPDVTDISKKQYWTKTLFEHTSQFGKWYRAGSEKHFKDPIKDIIGYGLSSHFGTGAVQKDLFAETAGSFVYGMTQLPAGAAEMAGATAYGAELFVKHPSEAVGVTPIAVGLMAGGMVKEFGPEMAGELTAGLLIGKAGKASPIKYGKVTLPEVTKVMSASGRRPIVTQTGFKGLFLDVPGTTKPIVGFKGYKPSVGAPLFDLPKGFTPATRLEAAVSLATKRSKLKPTEHAVLESRLKLMEELQFDKPSTPEMIRFGEQKYVPPEASAIIERVIRSEKEHLLYGSATQRAQLKSGRLPKDIDIEVLEPTFTARKILKELESEYPGQYRISKKTPTIVEIKTKTGWHHMVDIHEIISPGELIGYGMQTQKPIQTGWQLQRPIGEQLVRKGERTIRFEHRGQLSPGRRTKDIGDFHSIAESMLEQRRLLAEHSTLAVYGRYKTGKLETALQISKGEKVVEPSSPLIDMLKVKEFVTETSAEAQLFGKGKPISKAPKKVEFDPLKFKDIYEKTYGFKKISDVPKTKYGLLPITDLSGGYTDYINIPYKTKAAPPSILPTRYEPKKYEKKDEYVPVSFIPVSHVVPYEVPTKDYDIKTKDVTGVLKSSITPPVYDDPLIFGKPSSTPSRRVVKFPDLDKEYRRRKKPKKSKLGYLERQHLIGDPLTALQGMAKEVQDAGSMFILDKSGKLNSGFISDENPMFGNILPTQQRKPSRKASKRKKKQSNMFGW